MTAFHSSARLPTAQAPIGVFDSGVGGLSVLQHIRQQLPAESLIYCADSRYAPYGSQTQEFIQQRSRFLTEFLLNRNIKALVVACNTATAAAIAMLRTEYALPIIGMEPAVKPAASASRSGVIGVLATSGTLKSAQFSALLEHYGQGVTVITQACHGLVECIERGELSGLYMESLLRSYLAPLIAAGADTIVLGCTHYPYVRPVIEGLIKEIQVAEHLSGDIVLIDTGRAVAKQLEYKLQKAGLAADTVKSESMLELWTNADKHVADQVMTQLWGSRIDAYQLPD